MKYLSYSRVAQSVEQLAVNQWVVGSSPTGGAQSENCHLLNSLINDIWHKKSFSNRIARLGNKTDEIGVILLV